jgi:hypothetical protein
VRERHVPNLHSGDLVHDVSVQHDLQPDDTDGVLRVADRLDLDAGSLRQRQPLLANAPA